MKPIIQFAIDFAAYVAKGGTKFYTWVLFLCFFIFLMVISSYKQMTTGMIVTNLTDQVS